MTTDIRPVAIVTGASSGIGAALGTELVRQGFRVAALARNQGALEAVKAQLTQNAQGDFLVLPCDVSIEANVRTTVQLVIERWQRIDWVIANAGFGVVGEVSRLRPDDYHRQFAVNFFGVLHILQASLPHLERSSGHIGIIGSVNSYVALPGNSAYAASKFMVRALAESLSAELHAKKISITFVAPGFVKSNIRLVNNLNELRAEFRDSVPPWIQMPAETAAKKIIRAIRGRRRELVLTLHARVIIWIKAVAPSLWSCLVRVAGIRARSEPR